MQIFNLFSYLLDRPLIYNFLRKRHHGKLVDVIKKEILIEIKEGDLVLDFGCGPATNAELFGNFFYVGIDKNSRYITYARNKYPQKFFLIANICQSFGINARFDWILGNCVFHNLSDKEVIYALQELKSLLKNNGKILIIDLLKPTRDNYLGRFMVSLDRGRYTRGLIHYEKLFLQDFKIIKKYVLKIWCWDFCIFLMNFLGN